MSIIRTLLKTLMKKHGQMIFKHFSYTIQWNEKRRTIYKHEAVRGSNLISLFLNAVQRKVKIYQRWKKIYLVKL